MQTCTTEVSVGEVVRESLVRESKLGHKSKFQEFRW